MFVLWDRDLLVMILPVISFITSTSEYSPNNSYIRRLIGTPVLSILSAIKSAQPNATRWSPATKAFELPYWALTVSLNVVITVAIVYRVLTMRRSVVTLLGEEHAKMYTSIIAMAVESAAIYATTGIVCIITFAARSNALNFLQPVLGQVVVSLLLLPLILSDLIKSN